jgi:transposase
VITGTVSELARRSGVNRGLLQTWRRRAARSVENAAAAFIPIRVEEPVPSAVSDAEPVVAAPLPSERSSPGRQEKGTIEIEAGGMHVRVRGSVDLEALRTVLAGLERRR